MIIRLVVIPLSFLRRLDSLKYTSVIALVAIGYLVVLVVYHFAEGDTMAHRGVIRVIRWGGLVQTLKSFPVIVFAYTCHQNVCLTLLDEFVTLIVYTDVFNIERDPRQCAASVSNP